MNLHLANELIPGYATLPQSLRTTFEDTVSGDEFIYITQQLERDLERIEKNWLAQLTQILSQVPIMSRKQCIESAQAELEDNMRSANKYEDYSNLLLQIKQNRLKYELHVELLRNLERLYVTWMQTTTENHFTFMNLESFNTTHAKILASNKLSMAEWIEQYTTALLAHIKKNIGLINGENPFPNPPVFSKKHVRDSLSSLYLYLSKVRNNQKEIKWCVDSLYKVADARVFFQATGFASQNGSAWLDAFDIVNYFRMAAHVAETKSILSKFMQPFAPIFIEYSSINREQNIISQIVRTLMPMVILAASVILVAALLSSLVIPEIAFLFILLPTVYLGLIAASGYIVAKDLIYNGLCQLWYGGQFKIPEYQVSDRMIMSFGNAEKALKVRDVYIDAISACMENEKGYKTQTRLSQIEQDNRKTNSEQHRVLLLEWYDIHSNPNLSTDAAVDIALNRLQTMGKKVWDDTQNALDNDPEMELSNFVREIADEIKTSVDRPRHQDTQQPRFFTRPACLKHREELEHLNKLKEEIGMCRPGSG